MQLATACLDKFLCCECHAPDSRHRPGIAYPPILLFLPPLHEPAARAGRCQDAQGVPDADGAGPRDVPDPHLPHLPEWWVQSAEPGSFALACLGAV